jgi:hypothetical protein
MQDGLLSLRKKDEGGTGKSVLRDGRMPECDPQAKVV